SCIRFTSGYKFDLSDHYRSEVNGSYLLTKVTHEASAPHYVAADGTPDYTYRNEFDAIPVKTPFRPSRITPKPRVKGSQTAIVVGKDGEEIYVDKYGRVKVQFYWDRLGKKDENSSCWIRVSQIWAGKNWGWMTIPRIGQEVVVDFLEGDPDRPLIVGRIYNAEQMPPYTLPDKSTQSGIKSRSSKGGGSDNFNEIRFEDKSDNEEIYIHAQKDMKTEVEHDDSQTVDNDRTIEVKGAHTETITKDTTITVKEGNHSLTLDQGNQATKISMGNQSTQVSLGSASHEAMQQIELKVGESSIVLTQEGITIKGLMISIEGTVQLEAKAVLTTVSADAMMTVKGGITMIN
ncbi:MAG: type VI secretion system tip protein VgrG, partial [Acidobacteriaceae bacterium]|nr:type VI secretion system tip protein VgrG [Acidobacteriaceae bacterium]